MKQRKLVVALLIMVAVAVSTFTFAYWASGVSGNTNVASNNISVGSGTEVTTAVAVTSPSDSALDLVPVGREDALNDKVSSISYTYTVTWNGASNASDATGATGQFSITALDLSGVLPSTDAVAASELALFTKSVTVNGTTVAVDEDVAITYGDAMTVVVTIEFTHEPDDSAQYDLIAAATLTINLGFIVDQVVAA